MKNVTYCAIQSRIVAALASFCAGCCVPPISPVVTAPEPKTHVCKFVRPIAANLVIDRAHTSVIKNLFAITGGGGDTYLTEIGASIALASNSVDFSNKEYRIVERTLLRKGYIHYPREEKKENWVFDIGVFVEKFAEIKSKNAKSDIALRIGNVKEARIAFNANQVTGKMGYEIVGLNGSLIRAVVPPTNFSLADEKNEKDIDAYLHGIAVAESTEEKDTNLLALSPHIYAATVPENVTCDEAREAAEGFGFRKLWKITEGLVPRKLSTSQ